MVPNVLPTFPSRLVAGSLSVSLYLDYDSFAMIRFIESALFLPPATDTNQHFPPYAGGTGGAN